VVYLAVAPKSNAVYKAFNEAKAFVKKDGTRPVPMHLRNAPTQLMKDLDYGKNYRYAHDEEGGFAAGERYLPDGMARPSFTGRWSGAWRSALQISCANSKRLNHQKN
jgi:putative ATPase